MRMCERKANCKKSGSEDSCLMQRGEVALDKIKFLVMDVDGTLTDGKIYMGAKGELCKAFDIKDGYGIHDIAIPAGMVPVIITGRKSIIVDRRCKELGIEQVHQGISNKLEKLLEITSDLSKVAYIGDDINDLTCMQAIIEAGGIVGCPADAVKAVIDVAHFISKKDVGDGEVREFIEMLEEMNTLHVFEGPQNRSD